MTKAERIKQNFGADSYFNFIAECDRECESVIGLHPGLEYHFDDGSLLQVFNKNGDFDVVAGVVESE